MEETDIRLFVCCHRPETVPAHPLLTPVQVGAALTPERFPGFAYDDTGENISARNRSYCELTAQYWAWKNVEADYYGFFHYRRYLYPDTAARRPYMIRRRPEPDCLGYDRFPELIAGHDLILPMAEDMYLPVREHYARSPGQRAEDLELAERIARERCPEMGQALDAYLSGTEQYFGNIFIMRRDVFADYCGWLFPLLEEFDARVREAPPRTDGYIAERLLGVYAVYRRDELRTVELPRVHFLSGKEYARQRLLWTALPPGSRRRSEIKRIWVGYGDGR